MLSMNLPLRTVKIFEKEITTKNGVIIQRMNYVSSQKNHICRIKEVIYGGVFHPFNPEMNFNLMKSMEWKEIK